MVPSLVHGYGMETVLGKFLTFFSSGSTKRIGIHKMLNNLFLFIHSIKFKITFVNNKMEDPSNGPVAKLATLPTLCSILVRMVKLA